MNVHEVLRRPVITEKSTVLAERGRYVFEVSPNASKAVVKEAVQAAFGVGVDYVHVMSVRGKMKRYGRRPKRQAFWKKAIVTLRAGDKIDLFGTGG